jgi:hypothetical protein
MANVINGRQILLSTTGVIPFGNFKISDANWFNMAAGATFSFTDAAGRVFTYTAYQADYPIGIGKLGWIEGPVTITALTSGNVVLILDK